VQIHQGRRLREQSRSGLNGLAHLHIAGADRDSFRRNPQQVAEFQDVAVSFRQGHRGAEPVPTQVSRDPTWRKFAQPRQFLGQTFDVVSAAAYCERSPKRRGGVYRYDRPVVHPPDPAS
jgi:hypothetical protein